MTSLDATPDWAGWVAAVALASIIGLSWGLSRTTGRIVGRRVWSEYLWLAVLLFLLAYDGMDVWNGLFAP
ncbi:MAG TPA: hypothetical protein VHN99_07970, partial [Deinococcales bacterium]|nr:hypothetical protein [Deinococcales bacterium]